MKGYKFGLHQELKHSFLEPCGRLVKMIQSIVRFKISRSYGPVVLSEAGV